MKREKFLWPLSQSHHRALVTAKRIREKLLGAGGYQEQVGEMAGEVRRFYDEELRLHFWDEEKILVLYEERMGREEPEPQRLRREHRRLESLMTSCDRKSLLEFAELLTAHVRFEEDDFFGRIEKVLVEGDKQTIDGFLKAATGGANCAT